MDFSYLLKILLKRKWYILGLTLIAVIAAYLLVSFKKNLYASLAQYSTGFTSEKVQLTGGSSGVDLYGAEVKFNNVIETFKSPKVIGMLSYTLLLHDLNNPDKAYRKLDKEKRDSKVYASENIDSVKRILSDKLYNFELLSSDNDKEARIIDFVKLYGYDYNGLTKNLNVFRVEGTDFINVNFRSENPELSATVVNLLGQVFINYYKSLTEQRGQASATTIRNLVNAQQFKVDSLTQLLLRVKVSQGAVDPQAQSSNALQTVADLEARLAEAKSNYYTYTQRLDYLKKRRADMSSASTGSGGNNDVIDLINKKRDLVNENSRKGGNDPALRKQIDDLNNQIVLRSGNKVDAQKLSVDAQDLDNQISETAANVNAAKSTISDYEGKISQYKRLTNVNPGSSVMVDQLQNQLKIENKALENIKEKYNQAEGIIADNPAANIRQTLIGQPSNDPEPSKKPLIMGVAGISMFSVAALCFLMLAIFDPSIKTPSQFARTIKLPLLSTIPLVDLKNNNLNSLINDFDSPNEVNKLLRLHVRKLRFEIENSGKKIFLFSSLYKGEGKTTIMQALSHSLLLSGKKVLLVDTNFSHNEMTHIFNAEPAIETVGAAGNGTNLKRFVSKTTFEKLDVIGSKGGYYTPSEVLQPDNVLEHLKDFNGSYDYIFLEGAALNTASDTWELIKYVEALVMVFSAASPAKPLDPELFTFTKGSNKNFLGAVLNKVHPENIGV